MLEIKRGRARRLNLIIAWCLVAATAVAVYILVAPVWPWWRYQLTRPKQMTQEAARAAIDRVKLPTNDDKFPNQLFIPKIGVHASISSALTERVGLNEGVWRLPVSATPAGPGRVVITGHRFKYLPPNNTTFYLLDKLEAHDIIGIIWQGQKYYYAVVSRRIVAADDMSVLAPTADRRLTLFTCDPLFSEEHRLIIEAEPIIW